MSATSNVDNAAGSRTRDMEEQCRQVDKIQSERRETVSQWERRVRRKMSPETKAAPTFAAAKDGPSLVRLDFDALKLVCAHVPKSGGRCP